MQTIEITTTQNVTIEYELASLRERFFALLIDLLVIFFLYIALMIVFVWGGAAGSRFANLLIGSFPIWFLVLYAFTCETLLDGQTLGKRSQKIRVVRIDGKPTSTSDLLLRSVLQLVDFLFSSGVIGALFINTTDNRQRLGDMAAGTTVIKLATSKRFLLSDILNISTLESYTPQYPQVKMLTEDDMLFIKNVIIRLKKYPNGSHVEAVNALYEHLTQTLDISANPYSSVGQKVDFFKILIKDYIVLTR